MGHIAAITILLGCLQGNTTTSTGKTPLTDLGTGTYNGYEGGLYPGGTNVRPSAHESAGVSIAGQIVPLDANGNPDPANGKIVMALVGMSNARMEFDQFMLLAGADSQVNPKVVLVNSGMDGMTADKWADPNESCWTNLETKLAAAGVTGKQLQVVWVKQTTAYFNTPSTFPDSAAKIMNDVDAAIYYMKAKYPCVKIAYLSSRLYGGYAQAGSLSPEPNAYESGFGMKWLVQYQVEGSAALAFS